MLRSTTAKEKQYQILDLTSLTEAEFEQLVVPFEHAFVRPMQHWTMDGQPRTARADTPYANSPLPTPEDRLLCMLSYLKGARLQTFHGALFAMTQSNANKWIPLLLVVLQQTLLDVGDAPARHLVTVHARLATLHGGDATSSPLFCMMAPNAPSPVPTMSLSKLRIIAARKSATPYRISCWRTTKGRFTT